MPAPPAPAGGLLIEDVLAEVAVPLLTLGPPLVLVLDGRALPGAVSIPAPDWTPACLARTGRAPRDAGTRRVRPLIEEG